MPLDTLNRISLLFVGDVMQHMPQVEAAWDAPTNGYNYLACFEPIKPWISSADIAIANLETTLAGTPYSGYPMFSAPDALVSGLKQAGFDLLGTANNHCCDRGLLGITRTIKVLDSMQMMHFGTYADTASYLNNHPLMLYRKGFKLALLNYTYGTNGNPVPKGTVVNWLSDSLFDRDLAMARLQRPDAIIAYVHWGEEYNRGTVEFQRQMAQKLFDRGVDIIIGSHPHVIEPMERLTDSLKREQMVVWSLGNFVSNQRKRYTDGGNTVLVTLEKSHGFTRIADAAYLLTWVHTPTIQGRKQYFVLPAGSFSNDTARLSQSEKGELDTFLNDSRELFEHGNVGLFRESRMK